MPRVPDPSLATPAYTAAGLSFDVRAYVDPSKDYNTATDRMNIASAMQRIFQGTPIIDTPYRGPISLSEAGGGRVSIPMTYFGTPWAWRPTTVAGSIGAGTVNWNCNGILSDLEIEGVGGSAVPIFLEDDGSQAQKWAGGGLLTGCLTMRGLLFVGAMTGAGPDCTNVMQWGLLRNAYLERVSMWGVGCTAASLGCMFLNGSGPLVMNSCWNEACGDSDATGLSGQWTIRGWEGGVLIIAPRFLAQNMSAGYGASAFRGGGPSPKTNTCASIFFDLQTLNGAGSFVGGKFKIVGGYLGDVGTGVTSVLARPNQGGGAGRITTLELDGVLCGTTTFLDLQYVDQVVVRGCGHHAVSGTPVFLNCVDATVKRVEIEDTEIDLAAALNFNGQKSVEWRRNSGGTPNFANVSKVKVERSDLTVFGSPGAWKVNAGVGTIVAEENDTALVLDTSTNKPARVVETLAGVVYDYRTLPANSKGLTVQRTVTPGTDQIAPAGASAQSIAGVSATNATYGPVARRGQPGVTVTNDASGAVAAGSSVKPSATTAGQVASDGAGTTATIGNAETAGGAQGTTFQATML